MYKKENIDEFVKDVEKKIERKTIYEVTKHYIKEGKNKGSIGNHIQEHLFGIKPNNKSEADFKELDLDLELKVTPMIRLKNDFLRAKERLVFSLISYDKIIKEINLYESSFMSKNKNILIIFYEYKENIDKNNFRIIKVKLLELLKLDEINQIEKDYNFIVNKILCGEANLISGSDTEILEACTKSSNKLCLINQPRSSIKAKPRAWAFKNNFVTKIYYRNSEINFSKNYLSINDVINQINLYENKSINYLNNIFGNFSKSKSSRFTLILKILKVSKIDFIKPIVENNFIIKTINIDSDFNLKEHVPLCRVDLMEMEYGFDFENSSLFDILSNKKIIFVVFQKRKKDVILLRAFTYLFPKYLLTYAKFVFDHTQKLFNFGKAISLNNSKNKYFFIKASQEMFFHVRPGAINKLDVYTTQFKETIVKQKFWINNKFLEKSLKEILLKK